MNNYLELSNKFIKYYKKRSITTIISIIITFFIVFGIITLGLTIYNGTVKAVKAEGDYHVIYENISNDNYNSLKKDKAINGICAIKNYSKIKLQRNKGPQYYLNVEAFKEYNNDIFNYTLVSGRPPENSDEIMIEDTGMMYLDKSYNLGDTINIDTDGVNKDCKIVGTFSKSDSSSRNDNILAVTIADESAVSDFQVFVNLKDYMHIKEGTKSLADKYNLTVKEYNDTLLKLYGQGKDSNSLEVATLVVVLLLFISIIIIRNSISLSIKERSKEFGLLKCIGVSKGKLRKLIIKENAILTGIAILMGIIISCSILKIIDVFAKKEFHISENFNVEINIWIIIAVVLFQIVAVCVSLIRPIRFINKVSPLEALNKSTNLKKEKFKVRKGKAVFRKIFGYEGEYAYTNLMRNKKKVIVIIISISLSITLFLSLNGAISALSNAIKDKRSGNNYSYYNALAEFEFGDKENIDLDEYINHIKSLDGVKEAKEVCMFNYPIMDFMGKYKPTETLKELMFQKTNNEYNGNAMQKVLGYDNEELSLLSKNIVEGNFDPNNLKDDEVILCNYANIENKDKEIENVKSFDINVGDEVTLIDIQKYYQSVSDGRHFNEDAYTKLINENSYKKYKVVAIINKDTISDFQSQGSISIIMSKSEYKKMIPNSISSFYGWVNLKIDDDGFSEGLKNYLDSNEYCSDYNYNDTTESASEWLRDIVKYINIFIVIIISICILNIINTVTTSQISRKKEYAVLRAIGINKRKLSKIICLESSITSIIACIIGILFGNIVQYLIILGLKSDIVELKYNISYKYMMIVVGVTVLVSIIASVISIKKVGNVSISETIKSE